VNKPPLWIKDECDPVSSISNVHASTSPPRKAYTAVPLKKVSLLDYLRTSRNKYLTGKGYFDLAVWKHERQCAIDCALRAGTRIRVFRVCITSLNATVVLRQRAEVLDRAVYERSLGPSPE
jgi:hypothetical protein